jgi:hypothetical protein
MRSFEHHDAMFARHDPAICLSPGVFRSLMRGAKHRAQRAEVVYKRDASELRFVLPFLLGAEDLRLLQVLVALAGRDRTFLPREPTTTAGRALKAGLAAQREEEDVLIVRTRLSSLLRELDRGDCRDAREAIRQSLIRLASVTVFVSRGSKEASAHLLSHSVDIETGMLVLALDPRCTSAALGEGQYVHIDLEEVRALKSDLAVLLHQRLCAWIDPGRLRLVREVTLLQYVFPEPASTSSARAKRVRRVRAALGELVRVGWSMDRRADTYAIRRPSLGPHRQAVETGPRHIGFSR